MASETNILLVTTDDNTSNNVKNTLLHTKGANLAGTCREVSQIRSYLSNEDIHAVIVDIDIDHSRVLFELSQILHSHPEVYVIVICSSFNKELVLRAMQAGARNFLEKQNITKDLSEVILQLSQTSKRKKKKDISGSIISIFSAGGGCGATTVAVNLANELRILSSQPVLIIDMDNCYGTMSTYMGIKSRYGIADVMNRNGLIDEDLIRSSAFSYMEDFHVLASNAASGPAKTYNLKYENLSAVLEPCRELYKYTLIDAPRISEQDMVSLAGLSDIVLIVYQLTIKDVHFAHRIVESLMKAGIASKKIIPTVNRFKKRGAFIGLEDSQKAIGLDSCQVISSDWKTAMKAANHGKLLASAAKNSKLRKDYQRFAQRICSCQTNNNI